jgi:hypothetical protein
MFKKMVFQMCGEWYKPSIVKGDERGIVCTPLSVNVFITLATQQQLEHLSKALFETPCITSGSHIEP